MPDLETELLISPKEEFESKVSNPMIEEGTDNHDKLKVAIDLMGDHAVTGELLKPFDSLIDTVLELIRKNYGSFEDAQYNRKFCNCLLDRIEFIEQPMKNLRARKNLMILLLIDQNYYDTLLCLIAILKESQRLINEISFLWNLRKFRTTNDIKIHFERVTEEFDKVLSKLNLEKPFDYEAQKKKDLKAIEYDISTMNKFLESVEGSSITLPNSNMEINPIFETVTLIKARLTDVNSNEITIKRIPPNELIRIYYHLCQKNDKSGGGGNVKVKRWLCDEKGSLVACKKYEGQSQKFQNNLILLDKLNTCPNILKFYGVSTIDWDHSSHNVLVYEWAERGNLKVLYEKFDMSWPLKLKIAVGISRGLLFLHGCDIMHYDLRCENIMINENFEPKITNFRCVRPSQINQTFEHYFDPIEHWIAPERLKYGKRSGYTCKCDIFSFGMLLWELAFNRIPYRGWSLLQISKHVLAGFREVIDFGNDHNIIEQSYSGIIRAAWQNDPSLRPYLYLIFLKLDELSKDNPIEEGSSLSAMLRYQKYDNNDEVVEMIYDDNEVETKMKRKYCQLIKIQILTLFLL